MKYYLFEENQNGGYNYKQWTFEELMNYFKPDEDESDDIKKAYSEIKNIKDFVYYLENYVNEYQGMHYHSYHIEEV